MERRTFMSSMFSAAAMAGIGASGAPVAQGTPPGSAKFYVWRQYVLRNGTQMRRLADFVQNAAIPALNRLGHKPVGVFEVVAGMPTPPARKSRAVKPASVLRSSCRNSS